MSVSVGGEVDHTDYTGLVSSVTAILGNGSGQNGYGQRVFSAENWLDTTTGRDITHEEWNVLRTDINKCSRHQRDLDVLPSAIAENDIIGANASGPSVTRITGDTFSIDSPNADKGVNDWVSSVSNIQTNANLVAAGQFTLSTTRAFSNSSRTTSWGGAGQGQTIYAELAVEFTGGYTTTNTDGTTSVATGEDHRRHFFNAGGDIRLSAFLNGSTAKDTDWGTMLGNIGYVVFGKTNTTVTGTGRARDGSTDVDGAGGIDNAIGNYQLTTGNQLIFKKNGSQTEYAENYIEIYARRNAANNTIIFLIQFTDADIGDKTGIGPGVDEPVLQLGGSMGCGIDLKRPTGSFVSVPEPSGSVIVELRLT
jgi:hypothetical protein